MTTIDVFQWQENPKFYELRGDLFEFRHAINFLNLTITLQENTTSLLKSINLNRFNLLKKYVRLKKTYKGKNIRKHNNMTNKERNHQ